jgi:TRAP-type C4-dicarboxylate transport system permease small subunit
MERFVRSVELLAGYSLGIIAGMVFLEAALRYLVGIQIPDAYTIASQLQGMAIFWGFATATFAGRHITVDIVWELCTPRIALVMDTVADLVSAGFFGVLAVMLYWKVNSLYNGGDVTNELQWKIWPFVLIAALGILCSFILASIRIVWRLQGRVFQDTGLQTDG